MTVAARKPSVDEVSSNRRIAYILAIVITVAWAISFLIDIVSPKYDPPASVQPLMLLVATTVFGEGLVRSARRSGDNGNDEKKKEAP